MKKASTYDSLKTVFEVAMDIEDEYAASGDETDHDKYDVKGKRVSPSHELPPRPSSSLVIGEAEVREIAREVTKKSHEEVLQAIEKKLHITGEREGVRCPDCMGKHLANECPHRKPRAPLSPPRHPKYCHICRKHGHDTDECFFNSRVVQPQGWPNPSPLYYPPHPTPQVS